MRPKLKTILLDILHITSLLAGLGLLIGGAYARDNTVLMTGASLTTAALGLFTWGHVAVGQLPAVDTSVKNLERLLPLIPAQYQPLARTILGDIEGAIEAIEAAERAKESPSDLTQMRWVDLERSAAAPEEGPP